jgi:hypothetical protein
VFSNCFKARHRRLDVCFGSFKLLKECEQYKRQISGIIFKKKKKKKRMWKVDNKKKKELI